MPNVNCCYYEKEYKQKLLTKTICMTPPADCPDLSALHWSAPVKWTEPDCENCYKSAPVGSSGVTAEEPEETPDTEPASDPVLAIDVHEVAGLLTEVQAKLLQLGRSLESFRPNG